MKSVLSRHACLAGALALVALCNFATADVVDMYVSLKAGGTGEVYKYAYDTDTHAATLDTGFNLTGIAQPLQMAIGADGYLYVASQDDSKVAWYDTATGGYIGEVTDAANTIGSGIALGPDTTGDGIRDLYSTGWNGWLRRIDGATHEVVPYADAGGPGNFERLTCGPDDNLYVVTPNLPNDQHAITKITTTETPVVTQFASTPRPGGVCFSPDGNYLYATDYTSTTVSQIDALTGVGSTWADGLTYPSGLAFGPDHDGAGSASDLFVAQYYGDNLGDIAVFDGSSGTFIGNVLTGINQPLDVLFVSEVSDDLPGDLNSDGFVGGDDLDIVRSFWGQQVTQGCLTCGDPSGDGFVGGDDLDIVRGNWGQGTPPAPTAIPEPGTTVLLLGAVVAWFFTFRGSREFS